MRILDTPKKTGEIHFQFDDNESVKISDIFDYAESSFVLTQVPPEERETNEPESAFVFEQNGKQFKLFIKYNEDEK